MCGFVSDILAEYENIGSQLVLKYGILGRFKRNFHVSAKIRRKISKSLLKVFLNSVEERIQDGFLTFRYVAAFVDFISASDPKSFKVTFAKVFRSSFGMFSRVFQVSSRKWPRPAGQGWPLSRISTFSNRN